MSYHKHFRNIARANFRVKPVTFEPLGEFLFDEVIRLSITYGTLQGIKSGLIIDAVAITTAQNETWIFTIAEASYLCDAKQNSLLNNYSDRGRKRLIIGCFNDSTHYILDEVNISSNYNPDIVINFFNYYIIQKVIPFFFPNFSLNRNFLCLS